MPRDDRSLPGKLLLAQDAERVRIAEELHNDIGQQVAALSLFASSLKRRIRAEDHEARGQIDEMHGKLGALALSLRRLSQQLHPAALQHSGIDAALRAYCKELSSVRGIPVEFEAVGDFEGLSANEALCLYRVAEGAIQSIQARVSVNLRGVEDRLELSVSGDSGLTDDPESFELGVIRERARLAGGEVQIVSGPGGGIQFTLPRGGTAQLPDD